MCKNAVGTILLVVTYFQNRGEDGQLLSLDDTIKRWFDMNETIQAPSESTCSVSFVVNGLAKDLGFDKYLERYT